VLNNIDFKRLLKNGLLKVKYASADNAVLENFRNQQMPPPRRLVPMIYEGLQKAPLRK